MAAAQVCPASTSSAIETPVNPADQKMAEKIASVTQQKEKKKTGDNVPAGVASARTWKEYVMVHQVPDKIKEGLVTSMRAMSKIEAALGNTNEDVLKLYKEDGNGVLSRCDAQIDVIMQFTEEAAFIDTTPLPKFFIAVALLSVLGDMVSHASSKMRLVAGVSAGNLVRTNVMNRLVRACAFGVPRTAWKPASEFAKLPAAFFAHLTDVLCNAFHMSETMTPGLFALKAVVGALNGCETTMTSSESTASTAYLDKHYEEVKALFTAEEFAFAPCAVMNLFMKTKTAPFLPLDDTKIIGSVNSPERAKTFVRFVEEHSSKGSKVATDSVKLFSSFVGNLLGSGFEGISAEDAHAMVTSLSTILDVSVGQISGSLPGTNGSVSSMARAMGIVGPGCFSEKDIETYFVNYLRQKDRKGLPLVFTSHEHIKIMLAASDRTEAEVPVPIDSTTTTKLFERLTDDKQTRESALSVIVSEYGSVRWLKTFAFQPEPLHTWPMTSDDLMVDARCFMNFLSIARCDEAELKEYTPTLQQIYEEHLASEGVTLPLNLQFVVLNLETLERRINMGKSAAEVCEQVDGTSELGAKLLVLAFQKGRQDVVTLLQERMALAMAGKKRKRDDSDDDEATKSTTSPKKAKTTKKKATKKAKAPTQESSDAPNKPARVKRKAKKAAKTGKKTTKVRKVLKDDDSDYRGSDSGSSSDGSAASPLCIDDDDEGKGVDEVSILPRARGKKPPMFDVDCGDTDDEDHGAWEDKVQAV